MQKNVTQTLLFWCFAGFSSYLRPVENSMLSEQKIIQF